LIAEETFQVLLGEDAELAKIQADYDAAETLNKSYFTADLERARTNAAFDQAKKDTDERTKGQVDYADFRRKSLHDNLRKVRRVALDEFADIRVDLNLPPVPDSAQ
jgi:multidrug resistance efflux pump